MVSTCRTTPFVAALMIATGASAPLSSQESQGESLYDSDETTDVTWEDVEDLDDWTRMAHGGMKLAPILSSSTFDDVSLAFGGREELTVYTDTIQWKWDPDEPSGDGRVLLRGDDWEVPGGTLDLQWMAALDHRPDLDAWALDVKSQSFGCEEFLDLAPADWLAPYGDIEIRGEASPWVEMRLDNSEQPDWSLRFGGVDECRVTEIKRIPDADWLPGGTPEGLNEPFATTTAFSGDVEVGPATDDYVPLDELPDHLRAAMYLSEEPDFHETPGWNRRLLARAVEQSLEQREFVAGGSSITQQLVKNLFLDPEKNFERKTRELVLAGAVDEALTKDRILELYVNVIEFGADVAGIGPAADHYFGKPPAELTPVESAFLAAVKPRPASGELYRRNRDATPVASRVTEILSSMHEHGVIDQSQASASVDQLRWRGD